MGTRRRAAGAFQALIRRRGQGSQAGDRAIELGVTLFGTAPSYGHGRAEEVLGRVLGARQQSLVVVTKCGPTWDPEADPKPFRRDSSRTAILDGPGGLHAQLQRLNTDYIDLWLVHWPDVHTPFEETMGVLQEAKAAGKVRQVGVSTFQR